jgi:hypothetical protein
MKGRPLANGMGPLGRWVMNMSCAWYLVGAHRVRSGRWRSTMTSLTFTCISRQTGRPMSNSLIVRATYRHLIVAIIANTSNRNSKTIMSSTKPQTSNPPNVPLPPPTYSQVCVTPLHPYNPRRPNRSPIGRFHLRVHKRPSEKRLQSNSLMLRSRWCDAP